MAALPWRGTLLLLTFFVVACRHSPPPADPAVVAQGQALYTQFCAQCHGANLEGQPNWKEPDGNGVYPAPPHDRSGHTWHHPDTVLLEIIAQGGSMPRSAMPPFGDKLSEQEMRAILTYIKTHWGPDELAFQEEVTRNAQP